MVSNGGWRNNHSPRRIYLSEALARQGGTPLPRIVRPESQTVFLCGHHMFLHCSYRNIVSLFDDSSLQYLHLIHRPILGPRLYHAHPLHNPQSALYSPEYGMLPIQPRGRCCCYEELATVAVRPTARHTYYTGSGMLQ